MRIVVALGGNSLIKYGQKGSYEELVENIRIVCKQLAQLIKIGHQLIITHGSGPSIGNLLIQQEKTKEEIPAMPLDACNAMIEGQLGYIIQNALKTELNKIDINKNVATIVTQTVVNDNDPAFKNPTKPIGPFYKEKFFDEMIYIQDKGYRRVVASPKPVEIVEKDTIRKLVDDGFIIVVGGGGGIPVIRKGDEMIGVEAVVDKDLCAEIIAEIVKAETFLILTDVDSVSVNFKKADEKKVDKMSVEEARKYSEEGQFGEGSMKPKIESCIKFLESGGEKCIISSNEKALDAMEGKAGTLITR